MDDACVNEALDYVTATLHLIVWSLITQQIISTLNLFNSEKSFAIESLYYWLEYSIALLDPCRNSLTISVPAKSIWIS